MNLISCPACLREVSPNAVACPNCGEPIATAHADLKSGLLAAGLNLVLPGAGYIYCGRVFLGIIGFIFCVGIAVFTNGYSALITVPAVVIDGFLCAERANKTLRRKKQPWAIDL